MDKLIWQPVFYSKYDFLVYLDTNFAKEMILSHTHINKQKRFNELMDEELKRLGVNWSNPCTFYGDSCFISQFYIGRNGVWLSTSHQTIDDLLKEKISSKCVEYNSHNVDVSNEAYALMFLFNKWVYYAEQLKTKD